MNKKLNDHDSWKHLYIVYVSLGQELEYYVKEPASIK